MICQVVLSFLEFISTCLCFLSWWKSCLNYAVYWMELEASVWFPQILLLKWKLKRLISLMLYYESIVNCGLQWWNYAIKNAILYFLSILKSKIDTLGSEDNTILRFLLFIVTSAINFSTTSNQQKSDYFAILQTVVYRHYKTHIKNP